VLAGVRNLGLDDPSAGVQIYIANFGVRSSRAASSGCSAQSRVPQAGVYRPNCRRAEWQALAECVARGGEHAPDKPKCKCALRFSSLADPMPRRWLGSRAVPP
jgi:hypothetical protein